MLHEIHYKFVVNDAVFEPIIYCHSHMIGIARDQRNLLDWCFWGVWQ